MAGETTKECLLWRDVSVTHLICSWLQSQLSTVGQVQLLWKRLVNLWFVVWLTTTRGRRWAGRVSSWPFWFILEGQQNLKVPDQDAGDTQGESQAKKHLSGFTMNVCGFPTEQDGAGEHPEQGQHWKSWKVSTGVSHLTKNTLTVRVKRRPRHANTIVMQYLSFQDRKNDFWGKQKVEFSLDQKFFGHSWHSSASGEKWKITSV